MRKMARMCQEKYVASQAGLGGLREEWISQEPWLCVSKQRRREEEEEEEEEDSTTLVRERRALAAMTTRRMVAEEGGRRSSRLKARLVATKPELRGRASRPMAE